MSKALDVDWEAVELFFFSSSLSIREVARKLGINEGTLLGRAHREKWTDRKAALARGELPEHLRPRKTRIEGNPEVSQNQGVTGENDTGESGGQIDTPPAAKRVGASEMLEVVQLTIATEAADYRNRMAKQAKRLPTIMEGLTDVGLLREADKLEKLDKLNRRSLELDSGEGKTPLVQIDLLSSWEVDPLARVQTVLEVSPTKESPEA